MHFSGPAIRRIALIVLLAFTGVRLADAHLHLCLDGEEPPLAVHTVDGSIHNDSHHHQAEEHQDRDIEPFQAALLKAGLNGDVFLIPIASGLVLPFVAGTTSTSESRTLPLPRPPSHLRPPLRGPPV